ncbi:hypothetical protein U8335_06495 [Roseiconus lacunae]|uniref:hypothetical protein n=1 Tax=Roseiconus lacunae TaxID=2605694 RepID=UPI00308FCF7F|nr:hypothetical protein U8335_06495 [Stieleria sp. HD01]
MAAISKRSTWLLPLFGASVIAALTFAATAWDAARNRERTDQAIGQITKGQITREDQARIDESARRLARAKFYEQQVEPLLGNIGQQNQAAAQRCLDRIKSALDDYHQGVDGFVNDMTSIRTRLGIIKRMPAGWWKNDDRVQAYVQEKFQEHLFSADQLIDDVTDPLLQFRADIVANQNQLLSQVQASLSTADVPETQFEIGDQFFDDLSGPLSQYASSQGTTSVELMIGAFVIGEVGAFAAQSVMAGLLARFAPSIAIGSAAGASATVGATATGAGGGSLGGPVGTAVGFGVGLAVGLIIDWWMTDQFEAKLSKQMHAYLNELEHTLMIGNVSPELPPIPGESNPSVRIETQADGRQGLVSVLPKICDQLNLAYRDRFFEAIVLTNPIIED